MLSISEVRHQQPGDDIYSSSPVSYVKLDRLPPPDDVSPIIETLMRGDYFVTSGEVLIPTTAVQGAGQRTDDRGRRRVDVSARLRRGGVGRRRENRSADRVRRPICRAIGRIISRFRSMPPEEVGALRGVGFAGNGAMVQPVKLAR